MASQYNTRKNFAHPLGYKNGPILGDRMSLTQFLKSRGFVTNPRACEKNDGYISPLQQEQFAEQLFLIPHIKKIAEIGFNGGHSAEHFFTHCKNLKIFASFDLNCYPLTKHAAEYFYQTYPNRFVFIPGDSLITIPELNQKFPKINFDLIYIDGCHRFEWALGDILNTKKIAHENTILWIDDLHMAPVAAAVKFCETLGHIQVTKTLHSNDPLFGKRVWAQARVL